MLSLFLPYIHTQFSHTSVQLFQDLGKIIRKVAKSFLILCKGSDSRTEVYFHFFLLQILEQSKKPILNLISLSLFIFPLLCILFLPVF